MRTTIHEKKNVYQVEKALEKRYLNTDSEISFLFWLN